MVKQVYLEENFRLYSPKYLLLCFLSCLVIASKLDVFILWAFFQSVWSKALSLLLNVWKLQK